MALPCAWSGTEAAFRALDPAVIADERIREIVPLLQAAIEDGCWVVLDLRLLRLARRVDAVIVTDRAVLAIQVRAGATAFHPADRLAAEDAALDLADFHAGSNGMPVIPVLLVPAGARARPQYPLPLPGAAPVVEATRLILPGLLRQIARFPALGRDPADWAEAAYAPVPGLIEAACMLYADHAVCALRLAAAGPDALARTKAALAAALADAQAKEEKLVVFVTGAPGAGKTLCGLDLAFAQHAAFLTGNPSLVAVLREALVRDAVARGMDRRAAARRVAAVIGALPAFRDHYVQHDAPSAETLLVIDEAQRCWSREHAIRKTRHHAIKLSDSEPGHLLDIAARRPGFAALVCLVGGGQEIHDGEGGLAAWGEALRLRPAWRALASEHTLDADDPRQRLPCLPGLASHPNLHLGSPIRSVHAPHVAEWVRAVLADRPGRAAAIASEAGGVPFAVTRSLDDMRAALRQRGTRSSGLVASSGARRLRAEGLGAMLAHQDEAEVARWFLDRWPDIRSGDALEVTASEFAAQGLELDRVGLCWDADLVRGPQGWQARRFRASVWTRAGAHAASNRVNAYRVLLTRARHGTVIWVPRGAARDRTRDPSRYDEIAAYLLACGAVPLDGDRAAVVDAPPTMEAALL